MNFRILFSISIFFFAPNEKENLLKIIYSVVWKSVKAIIETNKLKKYMPVMYITGIIFDTFCFFIH